MAYGVNPVTGHPGPAPAPPRDGDKKQARHHVNRAVKLGELPRPNSLPCVDCGHTWKVGERRHEYDHYLGYGAAHHYDVQAVCTRCQRQRSIQRGEWNPPGWKFANTAMDVKRSAMMKARYKNPIALARMAAAVRKASRTPESRARRSEAAKLFWKRRKASWKRKR